MQHQLFQQKSQTVTTKTNFLVSFLKKYVNIDQKIEKTNRRRFGNLQHMAFYFSTKVKRVCYNLESHVQHQKNLGYIQTSTKPEKHLATNHVCFHNIWHMCSQHIE